MGADPPCTTFYCFAFLSVALVFLQPPLPLPLHGSYYFPPAPSGDSVQLTCLRLSPSLLKKIERETWRESGISLIATVTRLMERLLDYRCRSLPLKTGTRRHIENVLMDDINANACSCPLQGLHEAGRSGREEDWMYCQFTGEMQHNEILAILVLSIGRTYNFTKLDCGHIAAFSPLHCEGPWQR